MKKFIRVILLAGILAALLCVTALAADNQSGVYDLKLKDDGSSYTLGAQTADKTAVSMTTTDDGKRLYAGAERITLTGANVAGFNLVLVMKGDETVITVDNLVYVDQQTDTVAFNIYPSKLEGNETYHIYLSNSNGTGKQEIATFQYYQAYTLGDVDEDGRITATDSMYALQMAVGLGNWTDTQVLAAKVCRGKIVTATDAMWIMQRAVGLISSFDELS